MILFPLFAFASTIQAAPSSLRLIAREVPDIKSVIRNPAPVDERFGFSDIVGLPRLPKLPILNDRAIPAIDKDILPPVDVVKRAKPSVEKELAPPVDVVKRAKPSVEKELAPPVDVVKRAK